VEFQLKPISRSGLAEAISKAEIYRYLNEPEEAESICRDILAVEPDHQLALRLLGLAITDQFTGAVSDHHTEALEIFQNLTDPYERLYYTGILYERRAKAQLAKGPGPHTLRVLLERALSCFQQAEKIRPSGNDDAILRWNRCVRLLESLPAPERRAERGIEALEAGDSPPI